MIDKRFVHHLSSFTRICEEKNPMETFYLAYQFIKRKNHHIKEVPVCPVFVVMPEWGGQRTTFPLSLLMGGCCGTDFQV